MLILTRREGEEIIISPSEDTDSNTTVGELFAGGPITVAVLVDGTRVKLGIEAPKGLAILREEIVEAEKA